MLLRTQKLFLISIGICSFILLNNCGVRGTIMGGTKDTLNPYIIKSNILNRQKNVSLKIKKLQIFFNEYIQIKNKDVITTNPYLGIDGDPFIDKNFLEVNLDSIKKNTTYVVNFSNAIADLNEGNEATPFVWTFSTTNSIDTMRIVGHIYKAEDNTPDSNINVVLYSDLDDSAVYKKKAEYIISTQREGKFEFTNLKPKRYNVFALEKARINGTYGSRKLQFGFINKAIKASNIDSNYIIRTFYDKENKVTKEFKNGKRVVSYTSNVLGNKIELEQPLILELNTNVPNFNKEEFLVCDTLFDECETLENYISYDSTKATISISYSFLPESFYKVIIKDIAFADSNFIKPKSDTLTINTTSTQVYGKAFLIFVDSANTIANPLLRIYKDKKLLSSIPLENDTTLSPLLFNGNYNLDLVDDTNDDLLWTTGDYILKRQPEYIYTIEQPLIIKPNDIINYKIILKKLPF